MSKNKLMYGVTINSRQIMRSKAQNRLNPPNYYLSKEAQKEFSWQPDVNLKEGIKKTVEWFKLVYG